MASGPLRLSSADERWLDSLEVRPVGRQHLAQQVLRTDASGMPLEWIDYREAVRLYCLGQVAYAFGSALYTLHGGTNARTGRQTLIEVNSMLATAGRTSNPGSLRGDYVPPLNNETLFRDFQRIYLGPSRLLYLSFQANPSIHPDPAENRLGWQKPKWGVQKGAGFALPHG